MMYMNGACTMHMEVLPLEVPCCLEAVAQVRSAEGAWAPSLSTSRQSCCVKCLYCLYLQEFWNGYRSPCCFPPVPSSPSPPSPTHQPQPQHPPPSQWRLAPPLASSLLLKLFSCPAHIP